MLNAHVFATYLKAHHLSEAVHISSHFSLFVQAILFLNLSFFCNEFFFLVIINVHLPSILADYGASC